MARQAGCFVDIESILSRDRTRTLEAASKKRALEEVAAHIADAMETLNADTIYERLINREKLGTTAIGHGVAIPHCRVDACPEIVGSLFRLDTPVDFGAFDDEPVDLLFVLLVPEEEVDEHLQALGMLAERFESETYRQNLKNASGDEELYQQAIADVTDSVR